MKIVFLAGRAAKAFIDRKEKVMKAVVTEDWHLDGEVHDVNGEPCINLESNDSKCWLSHIPIREFSQEVLIDELLKIGKYKRK